MSTKIILISSNNNGGGKSTFGKAIVKYEQLINKKSSELIFRQPLAKKVKDETRNYLWEKYGIHLNTHNANFKKTIIEPAFGKRRTGRDFLIYVGEQTCKDKSLTCWCEEWYKDYKKFEKISVLSNTKKIVIVEDIRKLEELTFFYKKFFNHNLGDKNEIEIKHIHLVSEYGEYDENFPDTRKNGILEQMADKVDYIKKE